MAWTRIFPCIALAACAPVSGTVATDPTAGAPSVAPPSPPETPEATPLTGTAPTGPASVPAWLPGTWTSPACGERTWPREVDLQPDGAFSARDLVSPCPPGVRCIWSGIIDWQGTWRVEGDRVSLAVTPGRSPRSPTHVPQALGIPAEGVLEEASGCGYLRTGSTP